MSLCRKIGQWEIFKKHVNCYRGREGIQMKQKKCKRHKKPKMNISNKLHLNRTTGKCSKTWEMNLGEEGKFREKKCKHREWHPKIISRIHPNLTWGKC